MLVLIPEEAHYCLACTHCLLVISHFDTIFLSFSNATVILSMLSPGVRDSTQNMQEFKVENDFARDFDTAIP